MQVLRVIALFLALWCVSTATAAPDTAPNIVYILADDLGYGDIGANNPESKIPTPFLDTLAAQGMRFTDAHTGSSVCTPSRYSLLTGRYCWRSAVKRGVIWSYGRLFLEPGRVTVATLLRDHGYATGVVGKWHLGLDWATRGDLAAVLQHEGTSINEQGVVMQMAPADIDFSRPVTGGPRDYGFEYSFVLPGSLDIPPYCFLENQQPVAAPSAHTDGNDLDKGRAGAFWRPGGMAPGFDFHDVLPTITRQAIAFLERQADSDKPFFLYFPLAAPHTPWVPSPGFVGTSGAGLYGDFVHMVDAHAGEVLAALDRLGLAENTLVIFSSDNGPFWRPEMIARHNHRSAAAFRGMKGDIWEGGHRVPYIARWPGRIPAGAVSKATTSLTHLLATAADLLGVPDHNHLAEDSFSILPVLLGRAATVPEQTGIMMHSSAAHFAWRAGDWKYIEKRGSGGFTSPAHFDVQPGEAPGQLYNLADDPAETTNLYFQHPEKVAELTRQLEQARGRTTENSPPPGR